MISREFLAIAAANLWRMKLRTALTSIGVMVGVGALTSMLSFGFGMQRNVMAEFRRIGLFRTIQVLPGQGPVPGAARHRTAGRDSTAAPRALGNAALDTLAAVPGVALVYPQQSFDAQITVGDSTRGGVVQGLPADFIRHRPFGTMHAGRFFAADSSHEAVVALAWAKKVGLPADSLVGRTLRIETAGSSQMIVAVAARLLAQYGVPERAVARAVRLTGRVFGWGRPSSVQVQVVGVAEVEWGFGFRMGEVLLPSGIAAQLDALPLGDPMQMLAWSAASSGTAGSSASPASKWSMVIVTVEQENAYAAVKKRIEALGFRTLTFPDQLEQMRKSFLVFDAFVALIGFIALFVASLGIANTMVMSILERTREIGILKALGAEDADVRALFLAEAAMIGFVGSAAGIVLGLAVSRLASVIAQFWMARQDIPKMDPFYMPVWVALAAVVFGTAISIVAALYPAARAARIDPVRALRHD